MVVVAAPASCPGMATKRKNRQVREASRAVHLRSKMKHDGTLSCPVCYNTGQYDRHIGYRCFVTGFLCRTYGRLNLQHEDINMKAQIIDGKRLAADTRAEIARGVAALKEDKGVTPGLAVILVGDNPASVSYVTAKEKNFGNFIFGTKLFGIYPYTLAHKEGEILNLFLSLNRESVEKLFNYEIHF